MTDVVVVAGMQWGDEGKGKIVDLLSKDVDLVVRAQGGNNAGHTILTGEREYKFHLIPSGILYPNVHCYVAGGCVVDPFALQTEIKDLIAQGFILKGRFHVSGCAHLILPYHKMIDGWQEELKGAGSVGTTRKGIGPCYSDKAQRIGLQVGDLLDPSKLKLKLKEALHRKNLEAVSLYGKNAFNEEEMIQSLIEVSFFLKDYVSSRVERDIDEAILQGKKVLLEGAHGSYLDQTFGTYPYVTSSGTIASSILAGAGLGPTRVSSVLGIVKAFTTRVGNGPFPTELLKDEKKLFLSSHEAREVGTTTNRDRRLGWFDAPLVRQSLRWSGASSFALMKLDVLDTLKEIKVCVGYRLGDKFLDAPPALSDQWQDLQPVYETFPGWMEPISGTAKNSLPSKALDYVKAIEKFCKCPVSFLSYGPQREKTIQTRELF